MAFHQITPVELEAIQHQENAFHHRLRQLAEQPNQWPQHTTQAEMTLRIVESQIGPKLFELISNQNQEPIELLWNWMFIGEQALYINLLHCLRMADGYREWPSKAALAIESSNQHSGSLLSQCIARSVVLTAWWQDRKPQQALYKAQLWARNRYHLSDEQIQIALSSAHVWQDLLMSGWGQEQAGSLSYEIRLAIHHRVRMIFVNLAGLAVVAHLLTTGGLKRLSPQVLQDHLRQEGWSSRPVSDYFSQTIRWELYRWFVKHIQNAYRNDPDQVFAENYVALTKELRRQSIADMINGPFFTFDTNIARDQSNIHWSQSGLGRDETNSYFHKEFAAGIFRCINAMHAAQCDQIAAWLAAGDSDCINIYDGATGSGIMATKTLEKLHTLDCNRKIKFQLTDVSAAALLDAWQTTIQSNETSFTLYQSDLAEPLIITGDHGTFDVAGQNLGGHHLPDTSYAAMIRGLVALTRPGGLIYLGDVDELMNLQVFNGLWANLYAVEWPRTSGNIYHMFSDPADLAVPAQPIDYLQLPDELRARFQRDGYFKLMIPIPEMTKCFPLNLPFYTIGFGYITLASPDQMKEISQMAQGYESGTLNWLSILALPGSLSNELLKRHNERMTKMKPFLV